MPDASLRIADDQPDLRAALRLLRKSEGFDVKTADSARGDTTHGKPAPVRHHS